MNQIASHGQLRMSYLRWALVTVPLIMALGSLSGYLSNSGYGTAWFDNLVKPTIMPPGWVFGAAWTVLYIMLGLAIAMILNARSAPGRGTAIAVFIVHMLGNFAWSPLFFGAHQTTAALWLLLALLGSAIVLAFLFARIRKAAAWLLVPYMIWLSFATMLNLGIDRLNPSADGVSTPVARAQIG